MRRDGPGTNTEGLADWISAYEDGLRLGGLSPVRATLLALPAVALMKGLQPALATYVPFFSWHDMLSALLPWNALAPLALAIALTPYAARLNAAGDLPRLFWSSLSGALLVGLVAALGAFDAVMSMLLPGQSQYRPPLTGMMPFLAYQLVFLAAYSGALALTSAENRVEPADLAGIRPYEALAKALPVAPLAGLACYGGAAAFGAARLKDGILDALAFHGLGYALATFWGIVAGVAALVFTHAVAPRHRWAAYLGVAAAFTLPTLIRAVEVPATVHTLNLACRALGIAALGAAAFARAPAPRKAA